ncbi:MAG TPA: HAD family hydrolase [Aggregatilineales bacterium]|nr:HAD family hydrolase [Aggregatilineales bacterium]
MLKAILFDMDDTLLDWSKRSQDWNAYEHQHLSQVYDLVARHSEPLLSVDDFVVAMRAMTREAWLEGSRGLRSPSLGSVLKRALIHAGVAAETINIEECLKAYDWQPLAGVQTFPDVAELLPMFAASGIKLGVITNAYQPMWMRDRELAALGLLPHLSDCRFSAADVGFLKPHPAIFEAALRCLGVTAAETIFVGDNPYDDIAGAQAAGMRAILRVGFNMRPLISGLIVPDGAINSLHELLPMLDDWYPEWRSAAAPATVGIPVSTIPAIPPTSVPPALDQGGTGAIPA